MRVQFPQAHHAGRAGRDPRAALGAKPARSADRPIPRHIPDGTRSASITARQCSKAASCSRRCCFRCTSSEIVRCTSLAIRRRREIAGTALQVRSADQQSDRRAVAQCPVRPIIGPRPGFSVQLGCAYAAAGNTAQAGTALQRAILVGGEFDHPLTSTALFELGRLALEAGDFPAASRYFEEATYASFTFPNLSNLEEAFRLRTAGPPAAESEDALSAADAGHCLGQVAGLPAPASLAVAVGRRKHGRAGRHGASGQSGDHGARAGRPQRSVDQSDRRAAESSGGAGFVSGRQRRGRRSGAGGGAGLSAQRFAVDVPDRSGRRAYHEPASYSDRVGMALYDVLLRDPTPGDWASSPLECLSRADHAARRGVRALVRSRAARTARSKNWRWRSPIARGATGFSARCRWAGDCWRCAGFSKGRPRCSASADCWSGRICWPAIRAYQQLAARGGNKFAPSWPASPRSRPATTTAREQASSIGRAGRHQPEAGSAICAKSPCAASRPRWCFHRCARRPTCNKSLPDGQVLLAFFATSRNLYAFLVLAREVRRLAHRIARAVAKADLELAARDGQLRRATTS